MAICPHCGKDIRIVVEKKNKPIPVIMFSFETRKFEGVTEEILAGWKDAYPAVDVVQQLKAMREWILANPDKRKANWGRFIVNWLAKSQEKGVYKKDTPSKTVEVYVPPPDAANPVSADVVKKSVKELFAKLAERKAM